MRASLFLAAALLATTIATAATNGQGVTTMQLATLNNIGGLSISPSGRYIVYQVYRADPNTNSYSNQWFLIDTSTGNNRLLIGNGGSPVLVDEDRIGGDDYTDDVSSFNPIWSSNDAFYYVRKDRGAITIHRFQLNGADMPIRGYIGKVFGFHQIDDRQAEISTRAPSKETEAEAIQLRRNGLLYFDGSRDIGDFPNGPPDMSPLATPHYFTLDLLNGSIHTAPTTISEGSSTMDTLKMLDGMIVLSVMRSPDGRQRICIGAQTFKTPRGYGMYLLSADGKSLSKMMALGLKSTVFLGWSLDSRHFYYLIQMNHTGSEIFVLDTRTKRTRQVTNASGYLHSCSLNREVTLAACAIESATRPANAALINLKTGKVSILTDLNPDFERSVRGIRTQTLTWRNKEGDLLFGTLTYPRGFTQGKRYPFIFVTFVDVGFQRGASGDEYPIFPLAEHGFFVLNVDVADSGGKYFTWSSLPRMAFQGPLDGMTAIAQKLIAAGLADPHGIGIGGLSYGSMISLYAASHSSLFRAAIGSHGGSWLDPFDYYLKEHYKDQEWHAWGLDGPPYEKNLKKWQLLSPALRATQTNAAILLNSNDKEYIPGLQYYWELRDHHKPVELWIFPDENHDKHQPIHRLTIYNRNIDWFSFWLQRKIDTDPTKRDQYKRWERLRDMQR